ncbi:hypothetical protein ACIQBJ_16915 [Kitasatospora sp. NPDC088391]|uniref:hypothetical protein n=1 Tax=Kitasatospora sp. NPDC088391 TaxID=3364074 RepID=UPI0037F603A8
MLSTSTGLDPAGTCEYAIDNQAHGAVSDVRMYPYTLTAGQVGALFASCPHRAPRRSGGGTSARPRGTPPV